MTKMRRSTINAEQERPGKLGKHPRRKQRCDQTLSRELKDGRKAIPGPRGACAPESESQGSE